MKNLFFAAIAVVAFSGVSMANNKIVKKSKKAKIALGVDCAREAAQKCAEYEAAYGCMTTSQYNWAYSQYYGNCTKRNVGFN